MIGTRSLVLCLTLLFAAPASGLELTSRQVKLDPDLTIKNAQKAAEALFKLDAAGSEPIVLIIGTDGGRKGSLVIRRYV